MKRRSFILALMSAPVLQRLRADAVLPVTPLGEPAVTGQVVPWFGAEPPPGWLPCDGRAVFALRYPRLYQAIGHAYGGAGPFFRVPNLRKREAPSVPLGARFIVAM